MRRTGTHEGRVCVEAHAQRAPPRSIVQRLSRDLTGKLQHLVSKNSGESPHEDFPWPQVSDLYAHSPLGAPARPGSGPPLCTPRRDRPWHPWLRLRSPSHEHPQQPLGPTSAFPESAHGVCRVNELCKQDPLPWLHWQTRRGPWSVLWGGGLLAGAPASCCPAWGAACHRTSRQSRWGGSEPPCWLPSVSSPYRPLTVVVPISQTRQPRHRE